MTNVKSLSILIAEDNEDHAELMIDTFKDNNDNNRLFHVQNGEQALRFLTKQGEFASGNQWFEPDLVLLDIKMPKLDGIATLAAIKNDEKMRHIPVVMVSTSNTATEIKNCYKIGASSYITKPLQFDEFTRKIVEMNLYWSLTSELPDSESQVN